MNREAMNTTDTSQNPIQVKDLLRAADVAARLDVGVCRVHQMIRAGQLPAVRIGKRGIRIPREAFEQHLAAMNAAAKASLNLETFAAAFAGTGSILADILTPSAETIARDKGCMDGFLLGLRNAAPR